MSKTPHGEVVSPDAAAAEWLARRDAGLTDAEEREFQRWTASDPRHAAAWHETSEAWRAFDHARAGGQADSLVQELARRQLRRRWRRSLAVAASLGAVAAALIFVAGRFDSFATKPDPSRGIISRTEQRVLEDGSVVELNRGAEITVSYEPLRRRVRLLHGEALFTVAKNAARPFIVSSGRVDVQAVGTAFAVKADATSVDVMVTEGKVAVARFEPEEASGSANISSQKPIFVRAGDRVLVPAEPMASERLRVEALPAAEIERRLAWRGPRLELAGTRVSDAVALFNRESRIQLRVADRALAELRLSGVFRADNAEGFARVLEANYGVEIRREGNVLELKTK